MKGQLADNEHRFVEFCSEGENIKDELGYFFVLQGQGTAIVHEELYIKDKFITPSSRESVKCLMHWTPSEEQYSVIHVHVLLHYCIQRFSYLIGPSNKQSVA